MTYMDMLLARSVFRSSMSSNPTATRFNPLAILAHLEDNASSAATGLLPECRASPTADLPLGLFV